MKNKNTKDKTEKKKKQQQIQRKRLKFLICFTMHLWSSGFCKTLSPAFFFESIETNTIFAGLAVRRVWRSLASMKSSTVRTSYYNLQSFLHYSKSLCFQNETFTSSSLINVRCSEFEENIDNLSLSAHVVRTTAKLLISRRWKNENGCEMSKHKNR